MSHFLPPDSELLLAIQQNDQLAFRNVYDRYWGQLYKAAVHRVGPEAAKDIIQDIMLGFWNRRHRIREDEKGSLSSYLFMALKYKIIRYYAFSKTEIPHAEAFDNQPAETNDSQFEKENLLKRIEHEVATLPPRMQQIFRLSWEQNLSIQAIAEQLGLSEQNVKNQLSEALKRLRANTQDVRSDWAMAMIPVLWMYQP